MTHAQHTCPDALPPGYYRAPQYVMVTPITVGWHLKHILGWGLLTGGLWIFTGYPLCWAGKRRANRTKIVMR